MSISPISDFADYIMNPSKQGLEDFVYCMNFYFII